MPRKPPKYSKTKAVKEIARKRVGSPQAARVLRERVGREKPKHKKLSMADDLI